MRYLYCPRIFFIVILGFFVSAMYNNYMNLKKITNCLAVCADLEYCLSLCIEFDSLG